MLKRQTCAKFQSQIFESEVIQILKVVRWHFLPSVYIALKFQQNISEISMITCDHISHDQYVMTSF